MEDLETRVAKAALYADARLRQTRAFLERKERDSASSIARSPLLQKRERRADVDAPRTRAKRQKHSNQIERRALGDVLMRRKPLLAISQAVRQPGNAASIVASVSNIARINAKSAQSGPKSRATRPWSNPVRSVFGGLLSSWDRRDRRVPRLDTVAESSLAERDAGTRRTHSLVTSLTSLSLHDVEQYRRGQQPSE